jgi:hypothetical protein
MLSKCKPHGTAVISDPVIHDFYFDPMRSRPRYHALLRKMNLEP